MMSYKPHEVVTFLKNVLTALNNKSSLYSEKDWDQRLKAVKASSKAVLNNKNEATLVDFFRALLKAQNYLNTKADGERQNQLGRYIAQAIRLARDDHRLKNITQPREIAENRDGFTNLAKQLSSDIQESDIQEQRPGLRERAVKKVNQFIDKRTREPAVRDFLKNNRAFLALKAHHRQLCVEAGTLVDNNLRPRSHSYFCGAFSLRAKGKADKLGQFIEALEDCTTGEELAEQMTALYAQKHQNDNRDSLYEILNKGQNFTTRFFSLKTTTISLLDKIDEVLRPTDANEHSRLLAPTN